MLLASTSAEPPQPVILLVGTDNRGHWLVQEQGGTLEGSFVCQEAAMSFARWERHGYPRARIELAQGPLTPRLAGALG